MNCTNVHGVFFIRIWWELVLRGDGVSVYCIDCYVVMGGDVISNDVTRGAVGVFLGDSITLLVRDEQISMGRFETTLLA